MIQVIEPVEQLLPLLRRFCAPGGSEYGIALGGAHAKGVADAESDLDLYLFARKVLSAAERSQLCEQFDGIDRISGWGEASPFVQGGTDFYYRGLKVECWLRNSDYVANIIAECQQGIVRHSLVTWTVMGFYNYCTLSDLHHMQPIDDPAGLLARWQAEVAEYPALLRQAIITSCLRAAQFWPDNFHYRTAVARADTIYVTGIVQQVVHHLIQVVFALNCVYFPGDKKLAAAIAHLPIQPERFAERIQWLLRPDLPSNSQGYEQQRQELLCLTRQVQELAQSDANQP